MSSFGPSSRQPPPPSPPPVRYQQARHADEDEFGDEKDVDLEGGKGVEDVLDDELGAALDIDIDDERDVPPSRPLKSFPKPDQMLWTYEDAKKFKDNFSKIDCTRLPDGTCIKGPKVKELEQSTRLACSDVAEVPLPPGIKANYRNIKTYALWWLKRKAKWLAKRHPELSWGTNYYKPFKWIESFLKSNSEKVVRVKKRIPAPPSAPAPAQARASVQARASTSGSSSSRATGKRTKAAVKESVADEELFSEDDDEDDCPKPKKAKKLSSVELIQQSQKHAARPTSSLAAIASTSSTGNGKSPDKQGSTSPAARAKLVLPSRALQTTQVLALGKKDARATPSSSPHRQEQDPENRYSSPPAPAIKISQALYQLKSSTASVLVAPSIANIRAAVQLRYTLLPKDDQKKVAEALQLLEKAAKRESESQLSAHAELEGWVKALEGLHEEDIDEDNEDELAEGFGHRLVGRWSYHGPLKEKDAWGGTRNACRVLAALLRIWAMGRSQLARIGKDGNDDQPLVHNHIVQVCDCIIHAFASDPGPGARASKKGARLDGATDAHNAVEADDDENDDVPSLSTTEAHVSTAKIKRLSRKACMQLLSLIDDPLPDSANRKAAQDAAGKAAEEGRLALTAAQHFAVEHNKPILGSVCGPNFHGKGKKKAC
ncbi:hypothetical protein OC835_003013 [Tilletia horrida]|nr:hypothetical protein OC835_003013 [Tilletia horrida]